jgi:peptidoglycan hydrolase CwlO-like protein
LSRRESCKAKLEDVPSEILKTVSEMSVPSITEELETLGKKIRDHADGIQEMKEDIPSTEEAINNLVQKIADIKSDQKSSAMKESLASRLVSAYRGEMLAGFTESGLATSLVDIRWS